jgi:hypothetical protein
VGAYGMPPGSERIKLGSSQSKGLINGTPLVNSGVGRSHRSYGLGETDVEWLV